MLSSDSYLLYGPKHWHRNHSTSAFLVTFRLFLCSNMSLGFKQVSLIPLQVMMAFINEWQEKLGVKIVCSQVRIISTSISACTQLCPLDYKA